MCPHHHFLGCIHIQYIQTNGRKNRTSPGIIYDSYESIKRIDLIESSFQDTKSVTTLKYPSVTLCPKYTKQKKRTEPHTNLTRDYEEMEDISKVLLWVRDGIF